MAEVAPSDTGRLTRPVLLKKGSPEQSLAERHHVWSFDFVPISAVENTGQAIIDARSSARALSASHSESLTASLN